MKRQRFQTDESHAFKFRTPLSSHASMAAMIMLPMTILLQATQPIPAFSGFIPTPNMVHNNVLGMPPLQPEAQSVSE